ncbi:hypothetical protein [Streptomyces sp. NEAU-L66]|uniref:hypothetical protein n=1 Tax=Streptomyces sp. NEAU-L66 TaxID=3390812 RepID=UPI0039C6A371
MPGSGASREAASAGSLRAAARRRAARRAPQRGGSYATADGDAETWLSTWAALARTVRAHGGKCAADGREVSARDAFLRAAGYFGTALVAVDGCADPEARLGELFTEHRDCFDRFAAAWDPPAERVAIPTKGSRCRATSSARRAVPERCRR